MFQAEKVSLFDVAPSKHEFLEDVLSGLSARPRSLPCKYFYDEQGSQLFDKICELDEYYLTRTELAIMRRYADEIAAQIGPQVMLVEYGSGASVKTRILLDALKDPVAYVPVDISGDHLKKIAGKLAKAYPNIEILPVCADFTDHLVLPKSNREPSHRAVYFPGSTIGNFLPTEACDLLSKFSEVCGAGGGLLIGIDLQKETHVLEAAYNDTEGVTAAFNLNILKRINQELAGDVQLNQFQHQAVYNQDKNRVELSLVSQCDQTLRVDGQTFDFDAGEAIHTEHSHKYTVEGFADLAGEAGFELHKHWTDDQQRFAVLHLVVVN